MRRLEVLGFSAEVARVALHVCGGNEQRASELCMSGLAFVHGGSGAKAAGGGAAAAATELLHHAPPAPLRCYICGGQHLTQKSLDIHIKACRRRFELREAKRPASQQRRLLEPCELPPDVECLERYYELRAQSGATEGSRDCQKKDLERGDVTLFEDWIVQQRPQQQAIPLLPCEFCKRTFTADRLETHQKVCLQRPKSEAPPPARRRSGSTTPPAAAVNAYKSFCDRLARCPGCSRQFRPELLPAHLKQCCLERSKVEASAHPMSRSPGPPASRAQAAAQAPHGPRAGHRPCRSPAAKAGAAPGGRAGVGAGAAPPRSPLAGRGCPARAAAAVAAPRAITFTPPGRAVAPSAAVPGAAEATPLSSSALVARGLLVPVPEEKRAELRAKVADRLPKAEILRAFRVSVSRHNTMYDALRESWQEQHGGVPPGERELWHGTPWESVPKILQQGFNRSFAGRHGTLLGMATYFSADPAYSQRFCDRSGGGEAGTKVLLLARVLVGSYCKGASSDVEPPVLDGSTGERFDSTVDNEDHPGIFAVFRDFQAVPLFLVEFRTC